MPVAIDVELEGFHRMMLALQQSDKIAYKEILQAMKRVSDDVKAEAKTRVPGNPVSNWGSYNESVGARRDLSWSQSRARKVSSKQRNYRKRNSYGVAYFVSLEDPAASIWSTMGSGTKTTTTQGEHLVQAVDSRFGALPKWKGSGKQGPRALVEAYYAAKPEGFDEEIARKIEFALERAMN